MTGIVSSSLRVFAQAIAKDGFNSYATGLLLAPTGDYATFKWYFEYITRVEGYLKADAQMALYDASAGLEESDDAEGPLRDFCERVAARGLHADTNPTVAGGFAVDAVMEFNSFLQELDERLRMAARAVLAV